MSLLPQFGTIVPTQTPQLLSSNYLQWNNNGGGAGVPGNFADFAQQYLPEIYEAEVERYGNRTLSGFLKMVGAEMPMTSDQVIWSEQNWGYSSKRSWYIICYYYSCGCWS